MNFCCLLLCSFLIIEGTNSHSQPRNKLLYILLDGFRYDYTDDQPKESLPGFNKFLTEGVRAEYMSPNYPSVSYPDWTTLMTGLWSESHGIVGNSMYDAVEKDDFSLYDAGEPKWWKDAEPIWSTSTKANLRTAVILMSRCDIPFDEVVPEYCEPFLVSIKGPEQYQTQTKKALRKLEEGFDFVVLYGENMDNVGHEYGPDAEERKSAVRDMDTIIVYMLDRIEKMGMTDKVNIVIVSDHGMVSTAPGDVNILELDDFLITDAVERVIDGGTFANIKVKPGRIQEVYNKLKKMPGVDVYLHDDIPDDLHFKNHKHVHDILLKPKIDTFIMPSRSEAQLPLRTSNKVNKGSHGYDHREEKMRAIFFAKGPDFKKNEMIPPIQNVDVYPLLAHLLRVAPRPNNGTMATIQQSLTAASLKNRKEVTPPYDSGQGDLISSLATVFVAFLLITVRH